MDARDATGKMSTMRLYIKGKNTALSAGRPLTGGEEMRLVDAHEWVEDIKKEIENIPVMERGLKLFLLSEINKRPTSVDYDNVVQQLERRAKAAHAKFMGACCYMEFEKYSQQYSNIKACLDIVKEGAINGDA